MSPFDLSQTLLVGGGLLVPHSSLGPPVLNQLMQMVIMVPGQGRRFWSVCFPNRRIGGGAVGGRVLKMRRGGQPFHL